jgi:hypothetical protein
MVGSIIIYSGATLLADGTQTGGMAQELKLNGQGIMQVQEFFRAAQVVVFDRGNKRNVIEFQIDHLHASLVSSIERALSESDTLPTVADFTLSYSDGTTSLTATMSAAGWGPIGRTSIGATSRKSYRVTGGKFSISTLGVTGGLNVIDGGQYNVSNAGVASAGTIDGGNYTDTLTFSTSVDGGTYL